MLPVGVVVPPTDVRTSIDDAPLPELEVVAFVLETKNACTAQALEVTLYDNGLAVEVVAPDDDATTHPRNVKPVPGVAVILTVDPTF